MKKIIISVLGQDQKGIIAKVTNYLYRSEINVLDITQTIIDGYFNMVLIADMSDTAKPFGQITEELSALGKEMGLEIRPQKEEIFTSMHRI